MSTLMPSTPRSTARATSSSTVRCHGCGPGVAAGVDAGDADGGAAGVVAAPDEPGPPDDPGPGLGLDAGTARPKNRPFLSAPKLENTSSTDAPRPWASAMSRCPTEPVMRR